MVSRNEDKGNPSTADRSHQLALTHLSQHTKPNVFTSTSNHQGCNLWGAVLTYNFADHWLAPWGYYSIQQREVYPVVEVGTLSNDARGNLSLHFLLMETLTRSCRSPKTPSTEFSRQGRTRRLHTIVGGMTSSRTYTLMIGYRPI